jgi:hypothetical protein
LPKAVQLRTYTIREGMLEERAARWRESVAPLRLKLGFGIRDAWLGQEHSRFMWVIRYGEETFEQGEPAVPGVAGAGGGGT